MQSITTCFIRLSIALLLIVTCGGDTSGAVAEKLIPTIGSVSFTATDFQPQINLAGPVLSIARNPSDIFEVFVASKNGGLWKSTNGGNNWAPVRSLPVHDLSVVAYYIDGSVLVTSREDFRQPRNGAGVWRSTDHGESWSQVAEVPWTCADQRAHGLAVNSSDGTVYVATSCGLLVSWEGAIFHEVPAGNFPLGTSQQFYSVAFNRNGLLLVGGESGIYIAQDLGSFGSPPRFNPPTSGLAGTAMKGNSGEMRAAFAVSPSTEFGNFVVAVTGQANSDALIFSQDDGNSWAPVTTKPPDNTGGPGGSPFVRIARRANGSEDLFVYYGNAFSIFRAGPFQDGDLSTLATTSWPDIGLGHPDPHDLEFVQQSGSPLADRALLVSTDGGLEICSFSATNDDVTCGEAGLVGAERGLTSILAMNVKGQVIGSGESAVRHLYLQTWHDNVWKSTDDGLNWGFFSRSEGSTIELERRVASPAQIQVAWDICSPCSNQFQDSPPTPGTAFPDVAGAAAPPTMIQRGEFAQIATSATSTTVSVTPNLRVATSRTPGWVQIATLRSGTAPLSVNPGWSPMFAGYSGPGTRNPILYQPYNGSRGVALAVLSEFVAPPGTGVPTIVAITPTYPLMQWTDSGGVVIPRSLPVSPGVTWTPFEGFFATPVIGMDPRFPSHLVTPDTNNNRVMRSVTSTGGRPTGRGAKWQPISDLSAMVVSDDDGVSRYAFSYSRGGFGKQSFVSAISFYPDYSNLVILGTVDNGLFFSQDNAATWQRIPDTEHIVNPLAFYWRSRNSVLVASHGRGLFEVRMRFTLPPSWLSLICSGCRVLPAVPRVVATVADLGPDAPKSQPISALKAETSDEVVLGLDGRINGVDTEQGQLKNVWTTVGSSYLTFGDPNSPAKYTVQQRSGFVGFKDLPEADQLRSQGEVVKGIGLSNGKVVQVIYGSKETATPVPPAPGQVEFPSQTDPSPTDPHLTDPYLRLLSQKSQSHIGPGDTLILQGYNFRPKGKAVVLLDGEMIGQPFEPDLDGRFVLNILSPKLLGPHTLLVMQSINNERVEASLGFGVTNTDEE